MKDFIIDVIAFAVAFLLTMSAIKFIAKVGDFYEPRTRARV